MRLYLTVKFDSPMNSLPVLPGAGGFEVKTTDGKNYQFDFIYEDMWVDSSDPHMVHWTLKDEDYDSFPETKELLDKLGDICEIVECYLDLDIYNELEEKVNKIPAPVEIKGFMLERTSKSGTVPRSTEFVEVSDFKDDFDPYSLTQFDLTPKVMKKYRFC